jgi:hypothetical protein
MLIAINKNTFFILNLLLLHNLTQVERFIA